MKLKYLLLIFACILLCTFQQVLGSTQQSKQKIHIVSKGETIYSIASNYKVSVQDIYDLNPNTKKGIKTKDVIRIPDVHQTSSDYTLHSIQAKETLYSVAKKYNVSIEDILDVNPGLSSESFRMGMAIRIPKNGSGISSKENNDATNSSNYTFHKVEGKETLYSLSKQYTLSMQEIADANPEIKNSGLKKDMVLRIPKTNAAAANTTHPSGSSASSAYSHQYEAEKNHRMQIGILLPFLDKKDQMQARFIEYYEGLLLAVEDVKKKGYSADIYVFDIRQGNNTLKLQNLLETVEIGNLDLIIGGVTDDEVSILSRFAEDKDIKYIVPFPVRNSSIVAGDNTYMANLPQADLYNKVADKFAASNKNNNIIIVSDNAPYNDKADFIVNIREALSKNYASSKTIQAANIATEIKDAVSLTKKNIIIPSSSSLVSLGKVVQALKNLKAEYPAIEVGLFGYPDWQAYYAQFLTEFFNNDTYIYSPFYANNNDEEVKEFYNRFQKWYNKPLIQTYPKYGLLGYDTGLYFLTALADSKNAADKKLEPRSRISTIQSTFYFEKATQQKGYVNTGLFFIHYDQLSNNISKIDHSK